MPAGCDFTCSNSVCEHFNKGFTITAPWPMGKIELVINSSDIKKKEELRKTLIDFKNQGRKYACITLPNISNVPIVAYRINLWSPQARCIWQFDVEMEGFTSVDEAAQHANLPIKCQKSGGPLLAFFEIIKEGINCPYCSEKMSQNRWFTKEDKYA